MIGLVPVEAKSEMCILRFREVRTVSNQIRHLQIESFLELVDGSHGNADKYLLFRLRLHKEDVHS